MTYLLMLVLYSGGPFMIFWHGRGHIDGASRGVKASMTLALLGGAVVIAAFFVGVSQRINHNPELNTPNLVPYLDFGAGLAGLLAFAAIGAYAARYRKIDKVVSNKTLTICVVAWFAALYLVAVAIDHWQFWHNTTESGLMSAAIFTRASDVKCTDGFIAFHKESGQTIRYRCATKLVLGPALSEPFIPWPAYQEGVSAELYTVTHDYLKVQSAKPAP